MASLLLYSTSRGISSRRSPITPKSNRGAPVRRFCSKSSEGRKSEGAKANREESGEEEPREIPDQYKIKSKGNLRGRASLSILSPYNRTAVTLGETGVIVFAGVDSTGARYSSWPRADSCKLIPPGSGAPVARKFQENSVTGMIYQAQNLAVNKIQGRVQSPMGIGRATGTPMWKVAIGDELIPGEPFLSVGNVLFFHQPKYKTKENRPLFVASYLLPDSHILRVRPGWPLLVAVYDPIHLNRFENFKPNTLLLESLGCKDGPIL